MSTNVSKSPEIVYAQVSAFEAFKILYDQADPKSTSNDLEAARLFHTYCEKGSCKQVRAKNIGVHFNNFPKLDVSAYNHYQGDRTTQIALEHLKKTPEQNSWQLFCHPCTYFTSSFALAAKSDSKDFKEMEDKCRSFGEAQNKIFKTDETVIMHRNCWATYTIGKKWYPVNSLRRIPCQDAAQQLKNFVEQAALAANESDHQAFRKNFVVKKLSIELSDPRYTMKGYFHFSTPFSLKKAEKITYEALYTHRYAFKRCNASLTFKSGEHLQTSCANAQQYLQSLNEKQSSAAIRQMTLHSYEDSSRGVMQTFDDISNSCAEQILEIFLLNRMNEDINHKRF